MFFLFGCITVEPDLKAGPVAVPPPVMHFPVLVYKEGVDVGNAAVQDIFHEGAETAVTAAADDQYLLASGEKLTQIAIVIPDDTSTCLLYTSRQLTDLGAGRQSAHSPNQKQQQCGNSRELPLQSLNPQSLGSRARDAEVIEVGVAAGGFGGEVKESKPIPHKVGEGVHHLQRAPQGDPLLAVGAVGEIG